MTRMLSLLLSLVPLTALAHFTLDSPIARGFDEDTLVQFPCGGQDTPSQSRTMWPMTGGPIQLTMEHDRAAVQVLMGLGDDVGSNFNIVLQPTIQEQGIGKFCLGDVMVPRGMNVSEGMNATIQVVTNGDPNGGLYNCADITFSSTAQPGRCTNGTNVGTAPYTGKATNANGTNSGAQATAPPGTGAAAGSTPTGAAGKISQGVHVLIGGAAMGLAVML